MTIFRKSALAVAITSSLALAACGGGGSGGSGATPGTTPPPSPSQTSLTGSAIKGPLQNAAVHVIEVDDAGATIRTVGETRTDADGEYSVNLSATYTGGMLKIVVQADDRTTMVCDAPKGCGMTPFKGVIKQGLQGLELKAYTEKEEGSNKLETSVSAWSTLAAERAEELVTAAGTLRNASQVANSDVSGLVGFDIATTRARSLTSNTERSADESVSAVMNAAAAALLFDDSSTGSLASKLARLTKSINEDMKPGSESGDLVSPIARVVAEARLVAESADSGLDSESKGRISNLDEDYEASTDEDLIVPPGATQAEKIAKFKEFVTTTRSWVRSIEDLSSDELTAAIDLDVSVAENALQGLYEGQLQFVVSAVEAALETLADDPSLLAHGKSKEFSAYDGDGTELAKGTLKVVNDAGLVLTLEGVVTNGGTASAPFNLTLNTTIAPESVNGDSGKLKQIAAATGIVLTGKVGDANTGSLTLSQVSLDVELSQSITMNADGSIDERALDKAFRSASLTGEIEAEGKEGDRFTGTVGARAVALQSGAELFPGTRLNPFSLQAAEVKGTFASSTGSSFEAGLRFNLNNASTYDLLTWSEYSGKNSVDVSLPIPYDTVRAMAGDLVDEDGYLTNIWMRTFDGVNEVNVANYKLNNSSQEVLRSIPEQEAANATRDIRDLLISTFESSDVRLFVPETGETITVSVVELLNGNMWINGPDYLSGSDGASIDGLGSNETAMGVRVYLANAVLPEGTQAILDPNTPLRVPGVRVAGQIDQEDGRQRFRIFVIRDTEIRPHSAISDRIAALYPKQGDRSTYFRFGEYGASSEISYMVDGTEENLAACLQDPVAFLGYDHGDGCRYALGAYSGGHASLSEGQVEKLNVVRDQALVERFGLDLTSRLVLDEHWVEAERKVDLITGKITEKGTLEQHATFPDLESEERFADVSLTLSTKVNVSDLPPARATVTVNRNTYLGADLLANVRWNGGNYSVALKTDDLRSPTSYAGRIFNTQGYELTINVKVDADGDITDVSGDAFLNGEDIGDLQLRDNGMILLVFPNGSVTEIVSLL